jgi:hypothetical protein
MRATVFLDSISHWCLVAVPAIRALYDLGAEVEIVLAPVADGKPMGVSRAFEAWCYTRGTRAYGEHFDAAWVEGPESGTYASNAATLVATDVTGMPLDTFEAMASEALVRGATFGRADVANTFAAKFAECNLAEFERRVADARVRERLYEGNARLAKLGVDERPTFVLENANGDRALLKGLWQRDAVVACANALLSDERAYAEAGTPPRI